jgi:hypothetical protein
MKIRECQEGLKNDLFIGILLSRNWVGWRRYFAGFGEWMPGLRRQARQSVHTYADNIAKQFAMSICFRVLPGRASSIEGGIAPAPDARENTLARPTIDSDGVLA